MRLVRKYILMYQRYCDIVEFDTSFDWFLYRNQEDLPRVGAWCKQCAQETAFPMFPIIFNGKSGYALKCKKCGQEYPMYKDMFIHRYVGHTKPNGGFQTATHGLPSTGERSRKIITKRDIERKVETDMCEKFGLMVEEYREQKKKWDEENKKNIKRIKNEREEFRVRSEEEEIEKKSNMRKELIEKGVLKYMKGVGLVNQETGEIIKL